MAHHASGPSQNQRGPVSLGGTSGEGHRIEPPDFVTPAEIVHRVPAGEVARAVAIVFVAMLGIWLLWQLRHVLFLLFLAILLATAIEPIVLRLRRGPFSRGTGTLAVYAVLILAMAIPLYLLIPTLVAQGVAFGEAIPERIASLRPYAQSLYPESLRQAATEALDRTISQPPSILPADDALLQAGTVVAGTLVDFVTIFVLGFYWILERLAIKRLALRLAGPARAREVNTVWIEIEEKLGGWVRGQLTLMAFIAIAAGLGYLLLGMPNPLLLAVVAGIGEMVPMVGPFIAFAPAVLVALTIDPVKALQVTVFAIVIQQIEAYVLMPRVMRHAVGISPLTVLLGILIGATLAGLPGAFLAVPVAGAIQVLFAHLLGVEDRAQASAHPPTPPADSALVVVEQNVRH